MRNDKKVINKIKILRDQVRKGNKTTVRLLAKELRIKSLVSSQKKLLGGDSPFLRGEYVVIMATQDGIPFIAASDVADIPDIIFVSEEVGEVPVLRVDDLARLKEILCC